ncbi:hypothetical protein PDTK01_07310 [Phycicoccus sp. DTK01]|nr:hypothetical protein PDTK01_07310 [Phycicoccus sp. DTK01]
MRVGQQGDGADGDDHPPTLGAAASTGRAGVRPVRRRPLEWPPQDRSTSFNDLSREAGKEVRACAR